MVKIQGLFMQNSVTKRVMEKNAAHPLAHTHPSPSMHHQSPHNFFIKNISTMMLIPALSFGGCISAGSQDTNLLVAPPSPPDP
jgi:hypothetical protein